MLKVENLNVHYGAIHALKGLSFQVKRGEIVTLIGSNGAGKTTTLHTIAGLLKPTSGNIFLNDQDLLRVEAHNIIGLGMAQVPEGRRIFSRMTVYENLEIGAFYRQDKDNIKKELESVLKRFPRLEERKKQLAGTMSGGEQQMLAIARALMAKPEILLMDEPSMGLAPILVKEIFNIIQEINRSGTTILLVEQNATAALAIADRAYVLETGKVILEGNAKDLLGNDDVKRAYLG